MYSCYQETIPALKGKLLEILSNSFCSIFACLNFLIIRPSKFSLFQHFASSWICVWFVKLIFDLPYKSKIELLRVFNIDGLASHMLHLYLLHGNPVLYVDRNYPTFTGTRSWIDSIETFELRR